MSQQIEPAEALGDPAPVTCPKQGRSTVLVALPVTILISLFLLATGRWGSYLTIPGLNLYIGDIGVGLALIQVAVGVGTGAATVRCLSRSPLLLLLVMTLLAYAAMRLAVGGGMSLIALRDAAPYGYACVALLTFLLPARQTPHLRPVIYTVLVLHLAWASFLRWIPGYPWHLPVLGTDAMIFVIRPDFDATVLGIGAALALRDLLTGHRSFSRLPSAGLAGFAGLSTVAMLAISTRAGLLASAAALVAVGVSRLSGRGDHSRTGQPRMLHRVAAVIGALGLVSAAAMTPAGSRLLAGFGIGPDADGAGGTINARMDVWSRVTHYVLSQPDHTAVGVGFGPDFITMSGAAAALEGIYQNVRSPHNYIVGTMARLGVGGALLVAIIIAMGWWLALSMLRRRDLDTPTALAALVVIAIPVASLLGVILESPFGAIPYFWALGQLAAASTLAATTPVPVAERDAPG